MHIGVVELNGSQRKADGHECGKWTCMVGLTRVGGGKRKQFIIIIIRVSLVVLYNECVFFTIKFIKISSYLVFCG